MIHKLHKITIHNLHCRRYSSVTINDLQVLLAQKTLILNKLLCRKYIFSGFSGIYVFQCKLVTFTLVFCNKYFHIGQKIIKMQHLLISIKTEFLDRKKLKGVLKWPTAIMMYKKRLTLIGLEKKILLHKNGLSLSISVCKKNYKLQ